MEGHEAQVTADAEGQISLWCSCDEDYAVVTYQGDYVSLMELDADYVEHRNQRARDVLR